MPSADISFLHHTLFPRAATEAGVKVDLREEKIKKVRQGLKSQAKENEERGEENIRQWKGAVALGAGVPPPEWK